MTEKSGLYLNKLNFFLHYIAHRIKEVEINRVYMDMYGYFSMNDLFLYSMWHIGQVKPRFGTVNKLKPQTVNMFISSNLHFQHLFL